MKQSIILLSAIIFAFAGGVKAQSFEFSSEKIKPGDSFTIKYNITDSPLSKADEILVDAYFIENGELLAYDLMTTASEGVISGAIQTNETTDAVFFSVKSGDGKITDGNDNKGYKLLCTNAAGEPVQGALAAKAMMYSSFYRNAGIDLNREKAFNLMKHEFNQYPASQNVRAFLVNYAVQAKQLKNEEAITVVQELANSLSGDKNATEENMLAAYQIASLFEKEELANTVKSDLLAKYPNGEFAQSEEKRNFRSMELDAQVAFVEDFQKRFSKSKNYDADLDYFNSTIASKYFKNEDWANFEKYLNQIKSPYQKAGSLNSVAWTMSGESIDAEAPHVALGLSYSKKSLELLESAMSNPASTSPNSIPPVRWNKNLQSSYAMYSDTYALLAFKNGDFDTALEFQEVACKEGKFSDGEMNERYSIYFEKLNGSKAAESLISDFISKGTATAKMREMHKALFMENNTVESAYDKYLVQLEKEANQKLREEIKEQMIEMDAPSFDLINLDGQNVSLESLKGKVVVVDFWATWCGPCKASFPGMQMAVNKYESSEDVAFVFIDTWERGEEKEKNASDFINSNNYTFNVLMDNANEVVTAFGVSGIPTKFVVDKKGKIRFKTVGYGGNDVELVNELGIMIEMAGGSSGKSLTGAP